MGGIDTWPEVLILSASALLALLIIYAILRLLLRGGMGLRVGKDGVAIVRKTALAQEEADRIADRIAERVNFVHECQYRDIIARGSAMFEPLAETAIALADEAIERGKNGSIKKGRAKLAEKLSKFEAARDERAMA